MSFDNVRTVMGLPRHCTDVQLHWNHRHAAGNVSPLREWMVKKCHDRLPVQLFLLFQSLGGFAGVVIYRPVLVHSRFWLIDLAVTAFFTIGLTAMFSDHSESNENALSQSC